MNGRGEIMQQFIAKIVIVLLVSLSVNPVLAESIASLVQVNYPSLSLTQGKLKSVEVINPNYQQQFNLSIAKWQQQKLARQLFVDYLMEQLNSPFDHQLNQARLQLWQHLLAIKVQADVITSLKVKEYQNYHMLARYQASLLFTENS